MKSNLLKLAEECGELTQATIKYYDDNTSKSKKEHLLEEMADVTLYIDKVKNDLNISDTDWRKLLKANR